MKCDICNSLNSYIKEYEKEFNVKGVIIKAKIKSRFCSNCNNQIYDEELDNNASKIVISKYMKKFGVEPSKIINFRKKYNLSQDLFSKIIGCAKKTLISYEKGLSIPNDTYLIIIKTLLENEYTIKDIIEANKDNFTDNEYLKIKENIYPNIGNNVLAYKNEYNIPNEKNGFSNFSYNKLKNLILILVKDGMYKTKLLKELFYIDFKCYKMYGYSLTGLEYARINYGPVPDNYEYILNKLESEFIIENNIEVINNSEKNIIKSIENVDLSQFNKDEIDLINYVKNYFDNYSVSDIVNFSHKEKGYIETKQREIISYEYAFDLQI